MIYTVDNNPQNQGNNDEKSDEEQEKSDDDEIAEAKERAIPLSTGVSLHNLGLGLVSTKKIKEPFLKVDSKDFSVSVIFDFKSYLKEDFYLNKKKSDTNLLSNKFKRFPFEKHFKISNRLDKNMYTKGDTVKYKHQRTKTTNSVMMFLNYFFKKEEYFKFSKKVFKKPITVLIII